MRRLLHLVLTSLLLALPFGALCPAQSAGAQSTNDGSPKPSVLGVDVTFLANEGFLLHTGKYSVLIDGFLREPFEIYGALPDGVYKRLVNALTPFDQYTIVLVSHVHPDHVQMRGLEKYLGKNNLAQLMASPQVIQALQSSTQEFPAIQRRVTPIKTVVGTMNKVLGDEMSVEFFELEHAGKVEGILNLGHLIEMGGVRILHVGDALPSIDNFAAYHLGSRAIDVAIVPYWFFNTPAGVGVLQSEIRARNVVVCHVPPSEMEKFGQLLQAQFPEVILFQKAMEKRTFLPPGATATPAEKAPEEGG